MSDEIKPELIEKTQKILGKHISKPVLSEKLLKKPPFRFLHDIVTAVIRDTGFLKGLFTESELISENVKERDVKIAFLTKLIEAVKTVTQIDLKVKPTKIIAGLEPSETNKLLQALGFALNKKIDSTEYVKKINSKLKLTDKAKKTSKVNIKDVKSKDSVRGRRQDTQATKSEKSKTKGESSNRDIKNQDKIKKRSKTDEAKKEITDHLEIPIQKSEIQDGDTLKDIHPHQSIEYEENIAEKVLNQENDRKEMHIKKEETKEQLTQESECEHNQKKIRSLRPKSARPQSGDLKKALNNKLDKQEENKLAPQNDNVVDENANGTIAAGPSISGVNKMQWSEKSIKLLLALYKEHLELFKNSKKTNKSIWSQISGKMVEQGYTVTWEDCDIKFRNLKKTYKRIKDNNKLTGRGAKQWTYFNILDKLFGTDADINPPCVINNSVMDRSNKDSTSEELTDLENMKGTNEKPRRKRQSDDEPTWLKRYRADAAQRHEEKMQLLRDLIGTLKEK